MVGLIPTSMAEVDLINGTQYTIYINDAGGLDASSVEVQVWVQGLHDGLNGTLDGLSDEKAQGSSFPSSISSFKARAQ